MKRDNRQIIGIVGTIIVHLFILSLLLVIYIHRPEDQEEGGVPVMLGNTEISQGMYDPARMTEVDIADEEIVRQEEIVSKVSEEEIITQTEESTIAIPTGQKKKEKLKTEKVETQEVKKPKEKTEAEKRAEAEKAVAELASKRISGAFGKGAKMENKGSGSSGSGVEGSMEGNSSTGKSSGTGGYGTFDLNGRSLGEGGLPRPVYNVQDEGRVVVTITVDPSGRVINTSINKRTNTVNPSLRKAAENAAKKARFNSVSGVNNQTGTITYYFKLK